MTGFTKRNCPIAAQFVADFREIFGDDTRVTFVGENGYESGTPSVPVARDAEAIAEADQTGAN